MIIATAKNITSAKNKVFHLKAAVDEPDQVTAYADGDWMDINGVPIFAGYPGLRIVGFTRKYAIAVVDGEEIKIMESLYPHSSKNAKIEIRYK